MGKVKTKTFFVFIISSSFLFCVLLTTFGIIDLITLIGINIENVIIKIIILILIGIGWYYIFLWIYNKYESKLIKTTIEIKVTCKNCNHIITNTFNKKGIKFFLKSMNALQIHCFACYRPNFYKYKEINSITGDLKLSKYLKKHLDD